MPRVRWLDRKTVLEVLGELTYKLQLLADTLESLRKWIENLEEEVELLKEEVKDIQEELDRLADNIGTLEVKVHERVSELEHKVAWLELQKYN